MEKLYYTLGAPFAYIGSPRVFESTKKYSKNKVNNWLQEQDAFTLHRQVRKKFPRRSYHVSNFNDLWEGDLADLKNIQTENDGCTFVFVVVDVLSKYAFAEPLKKKNAMCVCEGFKNILNRSQGRLPITFQSDRGKEFVNKTFQQLLKKNNILFRIAPNPDIKCACAERFIRTLKTRLWRYFTHTNTRRYVDVLQDIVKSYNNTVHSSTKIQPACVNLYNAAEVRRRLEERSAALVPNRRNKPKFAVGSLVRVNRAPNIFRKGYERGWTLELFKVTSVTANKHPHLYYLEDSAGEPIEGFYYQEELSPVRKENLTDTLFVIEKIIRSRGTGEKKECLIRWKGYPAKFDSWVPANSVVDV